MLPAFRPEGVSRGKTPAPLQSQSAGPVQSMPEGVSGKTHAGGCNLKVISYMYMMFLTTLDPDTLYCSFVNPFHFPSSPSLYFHVPVCDPVRLVEVAYRNEDEKL